MSTEKWQGEGNGTAEHRLGLDWGCQRRKGTSTHVVPVCVRVATCVRKGTQGQGALIRVSRGAYRALCARCVRAVRALCEKLAVLHHREFGKFRRLKGRH